MKIGNYKNIKIKKPEYSVSETEIFQILKRKQKMNSVVYHIDDRCAQEGDQAILDFCAVDASGLEIPGGVGKDYPLILGSKSFVAGFEEAILGHHVGESFDISVIFPKDYRMAPLRGKDVVFHTTLKALQILELQPLDDEFAKDFSEFESMEAWTAHLREQILQRRAESEMEKLRREIMQIIIQDSQIPQDEELIQTVAEELLEEFVMDLEMDGSSLEQYCERAGISQETLLEQKMEEALLTIQTQFVLHGVIEAEGLSLSEEEFNDALAVFAEENELELEEFLDMLGEEEMESIEDQLLMDKAMELILEYVIYL